MKSGDFTQEVDTSELDDGDAPDLDSAHTTSSDAIPHESLAPQDHVEVADESPTKSAQIDSALSERDSAQTDRAQGDTAPQQIITPSAPDEGTSATSATTSLNEPAVAADLANENTEAGSLESAPPDTESASAQVDAPELPEADDIGSTSSPLEMGDLEDVREAATPPATPSRPSPSVRPSSPPRRPSVPFLKSESGRPLSKPAPLPRLAIGKNFASVQDQIAKLTERLDALESPVTEDAQDNPAKMLEARLAKLESLFKPVHERVFELEERRRDADAKIVGLDRRLTPFDTRLLELKNLVRAYDPRIEDLEVARERFYAFAERFDDTDKSLEFTLDALVDSKPPIVPPPVDNELRETVDAIQKKLDVRMETLAGRLHSLETSDRQLMIARLDALEEAVRDRDKQIKSLEARLLEVNETRDDLKLLKGIGPKFERLLVAADITTFAQIASWKEADFPKIAKLLNVTEKRIKNSGWIEGAKKFVKS